MYELKNKIDIIDGVSRVLYLKTTFLRGPVLLWSLKCAVWHMRWMNLNIGAKNVSNQCLLRFL